MTKGTCVRALEGVSNNEYRRCPVPCAFLCSSRDMCGYEQQVLMLCCMRRLDLTMRRRAQAVATEAGRL